MMCVLLSFVVGARILMCGFVICCMGIKKVDFNSLFAY